MLTIDDSITIGLRKYREIYPQGEIPESLEEESVLSAVPGDKKVTVIISFSIRNQQSPYVLFKAEVDRNSSETTVITTSDWRFLLTQELDHQQSV